MNNYLLKFIPDSYHIHFEMLSSVQWETNKHLISKIMLFLFILRVMVFNATVNNISVISKQNLSHNVVWSTPRHEWDSNSQH